MLTNNDKLILSTEKAKAAHDAMRLLKDVQGIANQIVFDTPDSRIIVSSTTTERTEVYVSGTRMREQYANHTDFATAYGLGKTSEDATSDGLMSRVDADFYPAWMAENPMLFVQRVNEFMDAHPGDAWECRISRFAYRTRLTAIRKAGAIHGGDPQSAVAAAAGGLTQTAIER